MVAIHSHLQHYVYIHRFDDLLLFMIPASLN
jgi:hypothetical protein